MSMTVVSQHAGLTSTMCRWGPALQAQPSFRCRPPVTCSAGVTHVALQPHPTRSMPQLSSFRLHKCVRTGLKGEAGHKASLGRSSTALDLRTPLTI